MRFSCAHVAFTLLAVGFIAAVTGCQHAPLAASNDTLSWRDRDHRPRSSLVLDPRPLHNLVLSQPALQVGLPWYAARLDQSPGVQVGYQTSTVESSLTLTRDRQIISGGRVRDYYDRTTYRAERRLIVR